MKLQIVLLAALLLPFSGCLGIPDDAIAPGDRVSATVTVQDLATGEVLQAAHNVDFIVGTGSSDLGFEFERRLVAQSADFEGNLRISNDPSLDWTDTVHTQAVFEDDLVGQITVDQFTQYFGAPYEGMEFEPQFSFYTFRVESVQEDTVTYRILPEDGQRDPVAYLGAVVVTTVDTAREVMVQTLEAVPGQTFTIDPPSPFNPNTPLGLEPGAYQAVGNEGDQIVYRFSAAGDPALIGHDLLIHVKVLSHSKGTAQAAEPVDGNFGVRSSPQVNGAPSRETDYGAQGSA